jgi:hypothetical protein
VKTRLLSVMCVLLGACSNDPPVAEEARALAKRPSRLAEDGYTYIASGRYKQECSGQATCTSPVTGLTPNTCGAEALAGEAWMLHQEELEQSIIVQCCPSNSEPFFSFKVCPDSPDCSLTQPCPVTCPPGTTPSSPTTNRPGQCRACTPTQPTDLDCSIRLIKDDDDPATGSEKLHHVYADW